jgi:hypothetical protein
MSDDKRNETQAEIDNLEVEPLTDEDLESVPGGLDNSEQLLDCSCTATGGNCTS